MPNDFTDAMSLSWDSSLAIFGDKMTVGAAEYDCVIHSLSRTTFIVPGRPGQTEEVDGVIHVTPTVFTAMGGRKGLVLAVDGRNFRVANDPVVGPTSATVEIRLRSVT